MPEEHPDAHTELKLYAIMLKPVNLLPVANPGIPDPETYAV